jgi:hypothetical protein
MIEEEAVQLRAGVEAFRDFNEERFDIGALRMWASAQARGIQHWLWDHTKIQ